MRLCLLPLQTEPRNPQANLRRFEARLESLADFRPDLVCLPECAFTGYLYAEDDLARFSESIPGPTVAHMAQVARRYGIFLCFGLLERAPEGVYNTAVLLDPQGNLLLRHRKNAEQPPFVCGSRVPVAETPFGRLSVLICGDLFHDETIERLPQGVDLLLVPMARAFDERSPDAPRWERTERDAYREAVRRVGVPAAIVNALETGIPEPSFGGALLVGAGGELLAEAPHGSDEALLYDLDFLVA